MLRHDLTMTCQSLTIDRVGPPAEVVTLASSNVRAPGPAEVVVRMHYAPINPADLNFIAGTYGKKPSFPATLGIEGAGVVDAIGTNVTDLALGQSVIVMAGLGCWATHVVCEAAAVIPLPDGIDLAQAAMLRVNPATAARLLMGTGRELPPGAWVIQNAGTSAVAQSVAALAKAAGLRVLTLVRRAESVPEGDALTFWDDASSMDTIRATLGAEHPSLALNAVGGESALRCMDLLGENGTLVTYGAMARQPLKVPNGFLIFKNLRLTGFWLSRWIEATPATEVRALYDSLAAMVADGRVRQEIAARYRLTDFPLALAHAAQNGRGGKILFDLASS
jgi:mitochondrial enoyl-[acyl-carrier protein] reductase / trans-2-enoyl-CoA reductase